MLSNNAVVYSVFLREGLQTQAYLQLLYSVKTLRQHSQMPIKVFIAPRDALVNCSPHLDVRANTNLEVSYFDNEVASQYPSYLALGYAQLLDHRWLSALRAFELFPFGRVLYLDGDTIFHQPVELLFELYKDETCLWARKDVTSHISIPLGINQGMNDGQFIISRSIYEKLHLNFYETLQGEIKVLLTRAAPLFDEHTHHHLHWLAVQYTVLKMLNDRGVLLAEFNKQDVMLSTEPTFSHQAQGCVPKHILHHYFSGNLNRYLPREYWSNQSLNTQNYCTCGTSI